MTITAKHFPADIAKRHLKPVSGGLSFLALMLVIGLSALFGPAAIAQTSQEAGQTEPAQEQPAQGTTEPSDQPDSAVPDAELSVYDEPLTTEMAPETPSESYIGFDPMTFGENEFRQSCAACHGEEGIGDGPIAGKLTQAPPNLQLISERAGGLFPLELVYQIIDGRERLEAHGSQDMPIWGSRFNAEAALEVQPHADDATLEMMAASRIMSLVFYLSSIQSPAPDSNQ